MSVWDFIIYFGVTIIDDAGAGVQGTGNCFDPSWLMATYVPGKMVELELSTKKIHFLCYSGNIHIQPGGDNMTSNEVVNHDMDVSMLQQRIATLLDLAMM